MRSFNSRLPATTDSAALERDMVRALTAMHQAGAKQRDVDLVESAYKECITAAQRRERAEAETRQKRDWQ